MHQEAKEGKTVELSYKFRFCRQAPISGSCHTTRGGIQALRRSAPVELVTIKSLTGDQLSEWLFV